MNKQPKPNRSSRQAGLAAAALTALTGAGFAQDLVFNSFDADTGGWDCNGWGVPRLAVFDPTRDVANDPNSGSCILQADFATGATSTTFQICKGVTDLTLYSKFAMDVYIDPATPPGAAGNYGHLTLRTRPGWAWPGDVMDLGNLTQTGWTHIEVALPASATTTSALNLHWDTTFTATTGIWVDNLKFLAATKTLAYCTFPADVQGWDCGGWGISRRVSFDPALDVANAPDSGSCVLEADFTGQGEAVFQNCRGVSDLSGYTMFAMDVYVDPATELPPGGNYGRLVARLRSPDWTWPGVALDLGAVTSTGWTHFQVEMPPTTTKFVGVNIHWTANYTSTARLHVDNIGFVGLLQPPAPPTLGLAPIPPGLEIINSAPDQYPRQSIRTASPDYGWSNGNNPVTYAMTVQQALPPASPGFFMYMFLIGTDATNPGSGADWSEPNGIFLEISQQASGAYNAALLYKTNAPGAHGTRYQPEGLLAQISGVPNGEGTWSITLNGTAATLAAPNGVTADGVLPAEALPLFANTFVYCGSQPGNTAYRGRYWSLSRITIAGTDLTVPLDVDFTTADALDPEKLVVKADDAAGIKLRPKNAAYRLAWDLPANGFNLRTSPKVPAAAASWADPGLAPFSAGLQKVVYVPATALPAGNAGFFQLQK
jgi:hypothetical protein